MSLFRKMLSAIIVTKPDHPNEQEDETIEINEPPSYEHTLQEFRNCMDFTERSFPSNSAKAVYLTTLAGNDELLRDIVGPFHATKDDELPAILGQAPYERITDSKVCIKDILSGKAVIFYQNEAYSVDIANSVGRSIVQSETETVIAGPHDGFVENLSQNLSVIRKRIRSTHLKIIRLQVGEITKTDVVVIYLEDIANKDYVDLLVERIQSVEVDSVFEANMLVQLIDDNPNSVFPQFMTTERPDSICSKILGGRIACFVDGSPTGISAPTSFFEFFSSPDDYYQRWHLGTALRLLRFFGFIITIGFTALYVSVTTFHYEMIPHTMLLNLTESRNKVPFPPLIEALLMEATIELLREAGARLPTKIGQTIGIVGGIVIGQAAVQAGFTSNILIIAVASSAIASFTIPSYIMSATLRLIRFGLIMMAGFLGNLGLLIGMGILMIHIAGVTNLGASYLTPLAPMNKKDWLDTFVRGPFAMLNKRPSEARSVNSTKQKKKK
ncbi:spore germination protein [Paenibacillus soyae]|uniref:Spore germination protein n=1 Tax=Paenibacillus soyae TaxID=2969249 RepID=A0A9X2MUH0_9BACL|nr:spore germination protein [Paenibacillus soyae]MCR2807084.1 spore germination protein [Paenibacillus soyae]